MKIEVDPDEVTTWLNGKKMICLKDELIGNEKESLLCKFIQEVVLN